MKRILERLQGPNDTLIAGAPEGFDALFIGDLARGAKGRDFLIVARDDIRLDSLVRSLSFFAPDLECLEFPVAVPLSWAVGAYQAL